MNVTTKNILRAVCFFCILTLLAGCQEKQSEAIPEVINIEIAPETPNAHKNALMIKGVFMGGIFSVKSENIDGVHFEGYEIKWDQDHARIMVSDRDDQNRTSIFIDSTINVRVTFIFHKPGSDEPVEVKKVFAPGTTQAIADSTNFTIDYKRH